MKNKAFSPDEDARGFIKENRQWLNARVQKSEEAIQSINQSATEVVITFRKGR